MTTKTKLTARVLAACHAADKDFSYNENYTRQKYGVTHAQVAVIRDVRDAIYGSCNASALTVAVLKRYLAGEKIAGSRMHPDLEARLRELFDLGKEA